MFWDIPEMGHNIVVLFICSLYKSFWSGLKSTFSMTPSLFLLYDILQQVFGSLLIHV